MASDLGRALDGDPPLCRKNHPDSIESTGESVQLAYYAEALGISYYEAERRVINQRIIINPPDES